MTEPRYPEIVVELVGQDAFNVLGLVIAALCEAGVDNADVQEFRREATAGDYEPLASVFH